MKKAYSFDDVLIVPQYSEVTSRSHCNTSPYLPLLDMDIPVFAANMDTICGVKMAQEMAELGGHGILHRYMKVTETHNTISDWNYSAYGKLIVSVGSLHTDKRRIDVVLKEAIQGKKDVGICVDLAHGDSLHMIDTLHYIRENTFSNVLIAGNVCTYEGAMRLFEAGADVVKVGVGPGSACTTRIKTGCGYPQLCAVEECAKAGPIIADGGIRNYGDAAKALAVGADAVMIGGLLAGTDCTPNWERDGQPVEFRGMASKAARMSCGGSARNAEGISTTVPWRPEGSTQEVVEELVEGVQSAMSYSGATTLQEFRQKATIIQTTSAIIRENIPHIIT